MPSAAEPVPPATPGHGAAIIRIDRRPPRGLRRRRTPPPHLHTEPTPEQRLAETMEALFLARGQTLSDEHTAEIYRITLEGLRLMLDGSLAERVVGEDEHRHLVGMVDGMWGSPDQL